MHFPVDFLSSYRGVVDYHVYIPRLAYHIRVSHDATGAIGVPKHDLTESEVAEVVESVNAYLVMKHARFLAWCVQHGLNEGETH